MSPPGDRRLLKKALKLALEADGDTIFATA
jgi:hypothetical protein